MLLKNNTNATSRIGLTVKVDPKNPNGFIYSNPSDNNIIGIVGQEVPKFAPCNIITSGVAKVFVSEIVVQGSVIRGAKTSDNISKGVCKSAKSTDTPYYQIGMALESGRGLIRVNLNLSGSSLPSGYIPYVGATDDADIGDHFLTGRFIVSPGEAAVGLAGMVFQPGTLLTVPVAGTMEFDGTGIYLTPTNHRRFITLASDSQISTTTATTILSTTLWTGITNANELKAHRVYVVKGSGLINNQNSAAIVTITVNLGAVVINTLASPGVKLTDDIWSFEVFLTIRATGDIAAGLVSSFGALEVKTTTQRTINESVAVDTTIANDLTVKATWNAENASNWIKLTQCWLATAD
jgi:hypothetical protein